MNAQQRSRWRTLAEAELGRGNLLAPVVLDCIDYIDDLIGADLTAARNIIPTQPARPLSDAEKETLLGTPNPAPASSVAPARAADLDPGPQDEPIIEDLGPDPEIGRAAAFRDRPPTTL